MAVALPRSRSPRTLPGRFGRATAGYVDRLQAAMGSRYRPGTVLGPADDRLSTLHSLAGDPAPIMQYSGEIESLDRDLGIATVIPGMRFPGN